MWAGLYRERGGGTHLVTPSSVNVPVSRLQSVLDGFSNFTLWGLPCTESDGWDGSSGV